MTEIVFTGDIMLARNIRSFLENDNLNYLLSSRIKHILQSADFVIGNLECPISNLGMLDKSGFNASPAHANQLNDFDLFTLTNNHILDYGQNGLLETIAILRNSGFHYTGVVDYNKREEYFFSKIINEKNFCFFSALDNSFIEMDKLFISSKDLSHANVIFDSDNELYSAISKCRQTHDYVVLMHHGGNEMIPYPQPSYRKKCQIFIDYGADIVITTHPHVLGGVEMYKGKPIIYSLGDFIFDADSYLRRRGALLRVIFSNSIDIEIIPTYIQPPDFFVDLAPLIIQKKIFRQWNKISKSLNDVNYNKRYSFLYYKSLLHFQTDRFRYLYRYYGFKYLLKFFISKLGLITHYFNIFFKNKYK